MNNESIKNITSHYFNVEVANVVGINAAVIFSNISHWCKVNESNNTNMHDDEYWTYNSISSFIELFPYLSKKQIISSLDKLKEYEFIGVAEYNKNPYDRTKWYCDLTRKTGLIAFLSSVPKGEMDCPKRGNVHLPKRDNSITDNKLTDNKPDSKHTCEISKQVKTNNSSKEEEKEKIKKEKEIPYRKFAHLSISHSEVEKIQFMGYSIGQIDSILDQIENFKKNTNYRSLFLTVKNWLKKETPMAEIKQTQLDLTNNPYARDKFYN